MTLEPSVSTREDTRTLRWALAGTRFATVSFRSVPPPRFPLTRSEPPVLIVRLLPPLLPRLLPLGATQAEATGHLGHGARAPVRAQIRVRAGVVKGERPPRAPGRFRLGFGWQARVQVRVGHRVLQIRGGAKVGEAVDPLHL
eukprot:scaffold3743_cov63-Phaeocystis_antarctica.AAC.6